MASHVLHVCYIDCMGPASTCLNITWPERPSWTSMLKWRSSLPQGASIILAERDQWTPLVKATAGSGLFSSTWPVNSSFDSFPECKFMSDPTRSIKYVLRNTSITNTHQFSILRHQHTPPAPRRHTYSEHISRMCSHHCTSRIALY